MLVCKQAIYAGRVQGVGFRFTVQRLASGLRVAGYVKNLPTGEVELVAEGEADQVESLLQRVAQRMAGYIQEYESRDLPLQAFSGFEIRH